MPQTFGIKITGVLARVGYYGRVRFAICDPERNLWVDARFLPDVDGTRGWLRVDDYVFEVASGLYLGRTEACSRAARAELVLGEGGAPVVEELRSIWVAEPTEPYPP